ncbi:hypothetical protein NQ318_010982 [Aromia moschata]|uniref:Integrase zinc-binding domain-containing protein n=1 Tax=Aromia moschata TaxID=1265417 RepID=A0AAV8YLM7_9CUCU|nr:hypothetical protein NQ318_010982 [Aromia moschata]
MVGVVEPSNPELFTKSLLIGRTLIRPQNTTVVRVVNLKDFPQKITKGTELGVCETVTIVRHLEELQGDYKKPDANVLPECLQYIVSRAKTRLNKEQTKQLKELLRENKEVFALKSSDYVVTAQPEDKWSPAAIRKDQLADKDLKPILEWKEAGTGRPPRPDVSDKGLALKSYWAQLDSLAVEDGTLVRNWENSEGTEVKKQVLLPRSRVPEVLHEVHGGIGGGHLGTTNKALQKLRDIFNWANCRTDKATWYGCITQFDLREDRQSCRTTRKVHSQSLRGSTTSFTESRGTPEVK